MRLASIKLTDDLKRSLVHLQYAVNSKSSRDEIDYTKEQIYNIVQAIIDEVDSL